MKEAYKALQEVYIKYPELRNDRMIDRSGKINTRLFLIELNEKYNLDIHPKRIDRADYFKVSEHAAIGQYGKLKRRTISWSDDDKQPEEGEYLLSISFPTGPYIFSHNHGEKLRDHFNAMFNDIKTLSPKYSDTRNKCLYFTLDIARSVHDEYLNILKKYNSTVLDVLRQIEIDELESKLKKMKQS